MNSDMDEALNIFYIESAELLQEMETSLIRLDGSLDDTEAINSIFRAVHTIKGSAGIVGLDNIESFAHAVENLLDNIRDGLIKPTADMVKLLLECKDYIAKLLITQVENTSASPEQNNTQHRLLDKLTSLAPQMQDDDAPASIDETAIQEASAPICPPSERAATDNWHISLRFAAETFINGMDPMNFLGILGRQTEIVSLKTVTETMPEAGKMNPEFCYLGFEIDAKGTVTEQEILDTFSFVKDDCSIMVLPPHSPIRAYMELIDSLPEPNSMLIEIFTKGGALLPQEITKTRRSDRLPTEQSEAAKGEPKPELTISTIRVDVNKLNMLVDTVGELVISGAAIKNELGSIKNRRLHAITDNLLRQIDQVRDSSMSVRMVPIQSTFNRFKRMVHDICADTGKEIDLVIKGGETELDRTVIERIKDPLVHLIRNAADHGLEMPAERVKANKPSQGTLTLRAYQETGEIVIEVSDNGKGLNYKNILAKAIEKGIIKEGSNITENEALDLIFEPGLSTALEVTTLSGRGVGMDVVRRNIEALRGSVSITSVPAEGTTVLVRLPLTLAIIDGFLVRIGGTSFVVPMDAMQECLELTDEARKATGRRNHINLRGHVLPYINLRDYFNIKDERPQTEHVLVVWSGDRRIGLLVDKLVGEIHTVIKGLGRYYKGVQGISGATIMGDGSVALILDVASLVKKALQDAREMD